MNAIAREWVPVLWLVTASLCIVACTERANEASESTTAAAPIPLVVAPPAEAEVHATGPEVVTTAGGITARYTPEFDGEALVRIEERRDLGNASATGTYAFQGARLMRYEGAPLNGTGTLSLELDLQGKVIVARHDRAQASDDQISAIRTRAQLLRNHALAQRISRTHAAR